MEQVIKSMIDTDVYKASMMNYVLSLFPKVDAEYRFKNRGKQRFNKEFLYELQNQIESLQDLRLTDNEYLWVKENLSYLSPGYVEYFRNFRYNPKNIVTQLTEDNNLDLTTKGKWLDTILLEVPLMSIISELYFKLIDKNWEIRGQKEKAIEKIKKLSDAGCNFVDMGSRRRRSFDIQDLIIRTFVEYSLQNRSTFLGTSNCKLAQIHNLKAFGSQGHEIYQASQVLNSYNHCNYYALENWNKIFPNGEIGTALTDTVGVDSFLKDFNRKLSMLYFSVRHDSGDPFIFVDKMIEHYKRVRIDPREKTLIFSDSLNVDKCIKIKEYCDQKQMKCSFGIGTELTNSGFLDSPALNMVIKLYSINGFPTVKLSDVEGKENGDPIAVSFMKWIIKNQS
jgi:nicotinate phosphoribosyltransferase